MRQVHGPPQKRQQSMLSVNSLNFGIAGDLGNAPGGRGNSTSRHAGANLASGGASVQRSVRTSRI
jgi:hypothetical protein